MNEDIELLNMEVERLQKICRQKDERIEQLTRKNDEVSRRNERLLKNMEMARHRMVYFLENEVLPLGD